MNVHIADMLQKHPFRRLRPAAVFVLSVSLLLSGCSSGQSGQAQEAVSHTDSASRPTDTTGYLSVIYSEPRTLDFQCGSDLTAIALNVFDRLVEVQQTPEGGTEIVPSLASSWEISDDGLVYTFHLQKGVAFSNGAALTSDDVLFTFCRMLTHPDSTVRALAEPILGADKLISGNAETLEGIRILDQDNFEIHLTRPNAAFLASLSSAGASILDRGTTEAAGELFGLDPSVTIGTGPFLLREWNPGSTLLLRSNYACWSSAPNLKGIQINFITDPEIARMMFEDGELDILNLDSLGTEAEYFIRGDIYRDTVVQGPRAGITFLALNATRVPLTGVRIRRALQLSLNRQALLDAVYGGRGTLENGIFPHALKGYNPALPEIPYDPAAAMTLMNEAGYPIGFELTIGVPRSASDEERELVRLAAAMWAKLGIRAEVSIMEDEAFQARKKSGNLACYLDTWSASYDDPDNVISTYFGNRTTTYFHSLCYQDADIMRRVQNARLIASPWKRMEEYHALESRIIGEDAAWIPLFSTDHYYVVSPRTHGFEVPWNGSEGIRFRNISLTE